MPLGSRPRLKSSSAPTGGLAGGGAKALFGLLWTLFGFCDETLLGFGEMALLGLLIPLCSTKAGPKSSALGASGFLEPGLPLSGFFAAGLAPMPLGSNRSRPKSSSPPPPTAKSKTSGDLIADFGVLAPPEPGARTRLDLLPDLLPDLGGGAAFGASPSTRSMSLVAPRCRASS